MPLKVNLPFRVDFLKSCEKAYLFPDFMPAAISWGSELQIIACSVFEMLV
jgi:hypothetical protein